MYVKKTCLWSSILQPLVKSYFYLLGCAVKIEPLIKLASVLRAVSSSSTLQTTFTTPNFRAYVGDALRRSEIRRWGEEKREEAF
jgi:hypothetical protein